VLRLKRWLAGVAVLLCLAATAVPQAGSPSATWTLENDQIAAVYGWSPEGRFNLVSLQDKGTGKVWTTSAQPLTSLIALGSRGFAIGGDTLYLLPEASVTELPGGGHRLTLLLRPKEVQSLITLEAEVYLGQPFLRQSYSFKNLGERPVVLTSAAFLDTSLTAGNQNYRAFYVNQWVDGGAGGNFETFQRALAGAEAPLVVSSGSYGQHCSWAALRDARNNGLVFGWEFDGRAQLSLQQNLDADSLDVRGDVLSLNEFVPPGAAFQSPAVFLGSFRGNWDEAAYRTQRFVESVLAAQMPEPQRFPYVAWDSWGYQDQIDEALLRRAADTAARLGVELFTVDLGWAVRLGDWQADPRKFPSGLRALSDYVHSRGMKFGLHYPLLEADPDSAVLRAHPDWTASTSDGYYGAVSLCPSHRPVKEWVTAETLRLIQEYNVDWLVTDGVNMVKVCNRPGHTHNPANSNYANSVRGYDEIVAAVRRETPQVAWENCQSGGRMMTYRMVQSFATSATADEYSALTTRQAVHGATYPFPPRYTDRYLGEALVTKYNLRSGMFGGPWILMQRIVEWGQADVDTAAREVALYKSLRLQIRDGKVYHLTPRPDGVHNEVLQSHHSGLDGSVIFVFRPERGSETSTVMPRGLVNDHQYEVSLEEAGASFITSGRDLMTRGLEVSLPHPSFAEVIHLRPARLTDP
jgi:alpha-galactosidase